MHPFGRVTVEECYENPPAGCPIPPPDPELPEDDLDEQLDDADELSDHDGSGT